MVIRNTIRLALATVLAAGAFAIGSPRANAQGGFGGGPGGGQMPPEIQAKIKAWQKFRDAHKNLTNFGDMLFQVEKMNDDPGAKLDKKQSGALLNLLKPWRTKTTMSEDDAKGLSRKIGGLMTEKQLKAMNKIEPPSRRMRGGGGGRPGGGGPGGPGGGGPGGPGGGARPGGGRPGGGFTFPDPPAKAWNPLNPDTLPFERMRPQAKKNLDEFVGKLAQQSK
jgi:hypothetical protein